MDYKRTKTNTILRDVLDIYIKSGRINARIKKKADITKVLSDVTNKDVETFSKSVEKVLDFICKINVLIQGDSSFLNTIFAHKAKNNQSRTDQNFYLLWLLLDNIDIDVIRHNRDLAVLRISGLYKLAQKVPKNYAVDNFFDAIDNFIVV